MTSFVAFLLIVLMIAFVAGSADAWVRARMFDACTPMGPQWPLLEKPGWELESNFTFEEFRSGELNGPPNDKRFSWKVLLTQQQSDTKAKVRIDDIDNTKDTSLLWSGCIETPGAGQTSYSNKTPSIYIRIATGSVKLSYNNDDTPPNIRGWYCSRGTVTSGGIPLGPGTGIAVPHGIWHKVRVTAYTNGTWKMWINDGGTTGMPDMTGNLDAGNAGNYIQWGAVDSIRSAATFFTEYCYWGQGEGEIDPVPNPALGEKYDIGGVTTTVTGNTATITWNTEKATTINKVYYGKTFYNPDPPTWQSVDAVDAGGVLTANLTNLDYNTTYTFYCESTDSTGQEYDTALYTFKTGPGPTLPTQLINPGFESGVDIYPWVDVYPPLPNSDDTQHWGRVYKDIDFGYAGEILPASGEAFSGFKTSMTLFRKNSTIRQKVATQPGLWYKATMRFSGWGNFPYGPDDMVGRIMLDPNGDDLPGTVLGEIFTPDPDVWVGQVGAGVHGQYNEAVVYAKAFGSVMSVFAQADYNASNTGVRIAFDDITFAPAETQPPTSCAEAKAGSRLNFPVDLQHVVITAKWQRFDGSIVGYVEDPDRTAGLRIECPAGAAAAWPYDLDAGSEVDVVGLLSVNPDKELVIYPKQISSAVEPQNAAIYPLGVTNRNVGGAALNGQVGVENGTGSSNTGLLVRTWGKVSAVGGFHNENLDYSIYIDDGSNMTAADYDGSTTYRGLEVVMPGQHFIDPFQFVPGQTYVLIKGISSMRTWNGIQKPLILVRDANDIGF